MFNNLLDESEPAVKAPKPTAISESEFRALRSLITSRAAKFKAGGLSLSRANHAAADEVASTLHVDLTGQELESLMGKALSEIRKTKAAKSAGNASKNGHKAGTELLNEAKVLFSGSVEEVKPRKPKKDDAPILLRAGSLDEISQVKNRGKSWEWLYILIGKMSIGTFIDIQIPNGYEPEAVSPHCSRYGIRVLNCRRDGWKFTCRTRSKKPAVIRIMKVRR